MKVQFTARQKLLEYLSLAVLLAYIAFCFLVWDDIPDRIITHYNFAGQPDGYGSKSMFLFLPFLSVFVYIMMTACDFLPEMWNYPRKKTDTPEQERRKMRLALDMLIILKLECLLIFFIITYNVWQEAALGLTFTISYILLLSATTIYYTWQLCRHTKEGRS